MIKKILLLFIILCLNNVSFASVKIWFCPNDSGFITDKQLEKKWAHSRENIDVYKFYYQLILNDSYEGLKKKISFLQSNNIQIAVELPPLVWEENGRGFKIESFQRKGLIESVMKKLKAVNANLDYVALDEPLYFAHYMNGPSAVNYNLDVLASKISDSLKIVYAYYPNVIVGEIEPIGAFKHLTMTEKYNLFNNWFVAFNNKNDKPLKFLHDDVSWRDDWENEITLLHQLTKKNNLENGIIFNSAYQWYNSELWMKSARHNIDKVLSKDSLIPNVAVLQSWNKSPEIIADDNNISAHSSLVLYFINKRDAN